MMRIGIDFDNTIICYDDVFRKLAKSWHMVPADFKGNKTELRDAIQASSHGDLGWQRLQGKVYGEYIHQASPFPDMIEFLTAARSKPNVELFIVSHKTEFGHFDETNTPLREVSRQWLRQQKILDKFIPENHIYFESTREEKIERIKSLQCTHFIDDLIEVLESPLFPSHIQRILFQPIFLPWKDIHHALLNQ